jgi:hypothetical protein
MNEKRKQNFINFIMQLEQTELVEILSEMVEFDAVSDSWMVAFLEDQDLLN